MALIDIDSQITSIRDTLLGSQQWNPTKPLISSPDIPPSIKNEILYLYFLFLEKRQADIAAREKQEYYETILPAVRDQQSNQSNIILPSELGEANTSGSPFGTKNLEPQIALPTNVNNIYEQNKATEEAKKEWNQWKKDLKPFQGNNRTYSFPGPTDLPHVVDDTVANRKKFNVQTKPIGTEGEEVIYKSWKPSNKTYTGTPDEPISKKINEMLKKQPPGSFKFFIEKLHGRGSTGPFNKNGIKSGLTAGDLPNRMVFPAYLAEFNDSFDLQWNEYKFIGRGEPVSIYQQTTRTITLSFWVLSDFSAGLLINSAKDLENEQKSKGGGFNKAIGFGSNKNTTDLSSSVNLPKKITLNDISKRYEEEIDSRDEINDILKNGIPDWGLGSYPLYSQNTKGRTGSVPNLTTGTPELLYERSTFLAQCNYGWYRKDGKLKEQPFIRIRIADFFDLVCRVNSTQVNMDDFEVDLNPSLIGNIPMGFKCTMQLQVVHEDEPSSEYRKFYHRADRDQIQNNTLEAGERENKETGDQFIDNWNTGSPLKPKTFKSEKNPLKFPRETKENLQNLDKMKSVGGLASLGGGSAFDKSEFTKKENLKTAIKAGALLNVLKTKINNNFIVDLVSKKDDDDKSLSNKPVEPDMTRDRTKENFGGNEPQPLFPKFKDSFKS